MRQNILSLVKQIFGHTESKTPQQFAEYLVAQASAGDVNSVVAIQFLNGITYEQGMGYLQRLKHYEDFLPFIQKIEAKGQYMRSFIDHIKELTDEK